jgi:hypothetical protein
MIELNSGRLRLLFLVLAVANVLVFTFLKVRTSPNEAAAMRIGEVQINAGSVKLLGANTRGAGQAANPPGASGGASAACLEWGPISTENRAAADSALEGLALARPAIRRSMPDAGGAERFTYFVREPDTTTVERIAALQSTFPGTQINAGKCPDAAEATGDNRVR